jgi:hypothetical protein
MRDFSEPGVSASEAVERNATAVVDAWADCEIESLQERQPRPEPHRWPAPFREILAVPRPNGVAQSAALQGGRRMSARQAEGWWAARDQRPSSHRRASR